MPKRPRQHQLEDESRIAFRRILPKAWVFRDTMPDYGIDGEVELFDEGGHGTGHLFKVQLKATDAVDLNRVLTIQLRLDTVRYYRSLGLPILIVRYHSQSQKLYHRWFHTFDPYYGKRGKSTVTFHLLPEDAWTNDTSERLASQLEAIRRIRSPQISLPVEFLLTARDPEIHGIPVAKIMSEIRSEARKLPGVLKITSVEPPHALPSITIGSDMIVADLVGVTSFTWHTSNGYRNSDTLSRFPFDVLVAVAIALARAGHVNIGARMAEEYAPHSSIISHPQITAMVVRCMAQAQRITEALDLSEKLFERPELGMAAQVLMWPALIHCDSLSPSEREFLRRYLQKRVERAEEAGDRRLTATAHYNLGNHLRSTKFRSALHHYRKAAEYDPGYLERSYFWRELAGILFGCRRYHLATRFYERAQQLGERGNCPALLADSLLFSGRFRESLDAFHTYFQTAEKPDPEWKLKARVLHAFQDTLRFDDQRRQRITALTLASTEIKSSVEESREQLIEALNHDALCNLAWFNLGVLENRAQNKEAAFFAFLTAALIDAHDVEAWCNAMFLGWAIEQPLLVSSRYYPCCISVQRRELFEVSDCAGRISVGRSLRY